MLNFIALKGISLYNIIMAYTLYLKKGEEKRILAGHSWVYANEVQRIEGKDRNGSLATVCAWDGKFLGKGYINHLSKIIVRIFIREDQEKLTLLVIICLAWNLAKRAI